MAGECWWKRSVRIPFILVSGAVAGALFHVALMMLSVLQYQGFEYMGVQDSGIVEQVASKFGDAIVLLALKILLIHLAFGIFTGLLVSAWWLLLITVRGQYPTRIRFALYHVGTLCCLHIVLLLFAMSSYPQLFIDAFYNASWFAHALQVLGSEWIPAWSYRILFSGVTASYGLLAMILIRRRLAASWLKRGRLYFSLSAGIVTLVVATVWVQIWGLPDSTKFGASATRHDQKNVLIVAADSLRPDVVEYLDDGGIKNFAENSIVYKNAYTVFPRTFPAWVSILSGQEPAVHGIRHMFPQPEKLHRPYDSLPRTLRDAGYETAVFSDFAGDIFSRIDLGFEAVDVPRFSLRTNVELGVWKMQVHILPYLFASGTLDSVSALAGNERLAAPWFLTDRFLSWLSGREDAKPFFAVLFYSTTHFPYSAPYPYYREHRSDGYSGPHRFCKVGLGTGRPGAEDKLQVRANFMACANAVDVEIGRVMDYLERSGLLENTLVVLTADHGENLFESEERGNGHGDILSGPESLKIPLYFKVPGVDGRIVEDGLASNLDITPTILGFLGLEAGHQMQGVNLAALDGYTPGPDRPVFSETGLLFVDPDTDLSGRSIRYGDLGSLFDFDPDTYEIFLNSAVEQDALLAKHHMIVRNNWKLIYIPTRQGVRWECYDLLADPTESTPLSVNEHPECEALQDPLYQHMLVNGSSKANNYVLP